MSAPTVIAEVGCNHAGDLELAKKMIRVAAEFCEVDVVKFQKRNPRELLTPEQYDAPHPNAIHSFGDSYGAHREFLEFTVDQHVELMDTAAKFGVTYATSVWDMTSAKEIAGLNPKLIKIPSATNLHFELLGYLCDNYEGEIHLSLGMTTRAEEESIVDFFRAHDRMGDVVLYSCTSGYPVPFDQLAIREIERLKAMYGSELRAVGFSGHHLGIAVDVAAFALGATVVERHFTLDRTSKGTDHAASLEPDGMRRVRRDLSAVAAAMTSRDDGGLLPIEHETRAKLKWRQ
ncbi:N-acetylneuraminate synthase family protein [Mycobacterium sp. shizuoka-1]|uniref:N-acetylneuraminate synthase family protein n=1 Tax=Mycobacterium sp. shizuoka-1 TaxID=2039281 RepID=UPI0018EDC025|nr:N-acetylneuraminate synthase family protein [Mycobacterium sp. shizuoka-1]